MSNFNQSPKKLRKDRPLAKLHAVVMEKIAHSPSSSSAFLTSNGRGIRQSFAKDICKVMTVLVNNMCIHSRKVGVATKDGFVLRSWQFIANECGLPLWRIKQCVKFAYAKGWISSKQPREAYTGADNLQKWRGLASIKRINEAYFKDLAMLEKYQEAKQAAKDWLKLYARKLGRPIKYIQTPVTLLRRRRKEAAERSTQRDPIPV